MDETTIIVAIACLVVGLAVGSLLTRALSPQSKKRRELEARIQAKEEELMVYRRDVSDHLLKTSELMAELNRTHRQIGEQLARSALHLTSPEVGDQVRNATLAGLSSDTTADILPETPREPPKDYAPGGGILSEDYGLGETGEPGVSRGIPTVDDVDEYSDGNFTEKTS